MVAIKGMKMPKNCIECLLFDDEYGDCNVYGEPKANMTEKRAENCPLVEIVTCKDCKYCVMTEVGCYCDRHVHRLDTHLDKYCADGESEAIMKVYCAFKFKPFGEEQLVGIAKTQKGALTILKREFPHMRGKIENKNLTSDVNNTYLLDVREVEVEG